MKTTYFLICFAFYNCIVYAQEKNYDNVESALQDKKNKISLNLSNEELNSIPKDVYKIKNLQTLDLKETSISVIPDDIYKLKNLENLYILNENLSKVSNAILTSNIKSVGVTEQSVANSTILETYFYLKGINDNESMNAILEIQNLDLTSKSDALKNKNLIWASSSHAFGYLELGKSDISSAVDIKPDLNLKDKNLKITLDLLYVHDYPGKGQHKVLFDFKAKNQIQSGEEQIHFSQTRNVQEGQFSGILSIPVFIGINAGKQGLNFEVSTTNVKNTNDEKLMSILESNEIKSGLKLINSINPILPIVTSLTEGISKQILTRNENKKVQDFALGLNFSEGSSQAKLREGTYIAVQVIDLPSWNWKDWEFNKSNGIIVNKKNSNQTIPFNYIVFTITKI